MKRLFSLLLCTALMLAGGVAWAQGELLFGETFNQYATNWQPDSVEVSANGYYVKEYAAGEKGLLLPLGARVSTVQKKVRVTGDFCVSFDVMGEKQGFTGNLTAAGPKGSMTALAFRSDKGITSGEGKRLGGYSLSQMTNVEIAFHIAEKTIDIYLDKKAVLSDWPVYSMNLSGDVTVGFSFRGESDEAGVLLDNLNIVDGPKPLKSYPVAAYNPEVGEEVKREETQIGNKILLYADFETKNPFATTSFETGNKILLQKEADGNGVLLYERLEDTRHFYSDVSLGETAYPALVMEMDIKLLENSTSFMFFIFRDNNGLFSENMSISSGRLSASGRSVGTMLAGKWYKVACAFDFYKNTYQVYLDGEKVLENVPLANPQLGQPTLVRTSVKQTASVKFATDNYHIYEGTEPKIFTAEEIEEQFGVTTQDIYPSENNEMELLKGKIGLHLRSGILYRDGVKTLLPVRPYLERETPMVPVRAVCEAAGETVAFDAETQTVRVGDKAAFTIGERVMNTPSGEIELPAATALREDTTFVPLEPLVKQGLQKELFLDSTAISSGMAIISDQPFMPPNNLKALNDFLFYYRPSMEQIQQSFETQNTEGEHPRILARKQDFDKLRGEVKTSAVKQKWAQELLRKADEALGTDGGSIADLAMAYQLTGEQKYADQGYVAMKKLLDGYIWITAQYLDVGCNCCSVAIGYDWMYEALTPEQRKTIEQGLYDQALSDVLQWYLGQKGSPSTFATRNNNWNAVCNGGVCVGALALMDVYPEECRKIVQCAMRALEYTIHNYAPDGAWFEGPSYWSYGTSYLVYMLASLDSALGTDYAISTAEGLSKSGEFELQMQSTVGIFSFADAGDANDYNSILYWFGKKYDRPEISAATYYKSGMLDVYGLLWYDSEINPEDFAFDKDSYYCGAEVVTMRERWKGDMETFVGFKGGRSVAEHTHLDLGSFVFDSMGQRWAVDMGKDNYSLPGYWETTLARWKLFRMRAASHNTVVINPQANDPADHNLNSRADVVRMESAPRGAIGVLDMTQPLQNDAQSARRGFFFTDDRKSLVVRDELTIPAASDIWWLFYTYANDISIDGSTVRLMQNGRTLRLEYSCNADAELLWEDALPLPGTTPLASGESVNQGIKRLALKIRGKGKVNITVKLTPEYIKGSSLAEYDKSMDSWKLPEGELGEEQEIPPALQLDAIYYGEEKLKEFDPSVYAYTVQAYEGQTDLPEIRAESSRFAVEVQKGGEPFEPVKIKVADREQPSLYSVYIINYEVIPKPAWFAGKTSLQVQKLTVSSIPQPANAPIHLLDGNLDTRWSAEGKGQWAKFDLGSVQKVDGAMMSFYLGDQRSQNLTVSVSEDDVDYKEVFNGASSGTTADYEEYAFEGTMARYIKITYNETTGGAWNSPTEVVFFQKGGQS